MLCSKQEQQLIKVLKFMKFQPSQGRQKVKFSSLEPKKPKISNLDR